MIQTVLDVVAVDREVIFVYHEVINCRMIFDLK